MMRICPSCARPKCRVELIAIVYGRHFYACRDIRCQRTTGCKVEVYRHGIESEQRGRVAVDSVHANDSPGVVILLGAQVDKLGLGGAIVEGAANAIGPPENQQLIASLEELIQSLRAASPRAP